MSKKIDESYTISPEVAKIRFLILDVDGVMTDGTITYSSSGEELKSFDAKDGAGLKYWARAGLRAGIITGRSSPVVLRRARELDIQFVEMDAKDKMPALSRMLAAAGVSAEETAVMGDDLPDLPLLRHAGVGIAVADAVRELKDMADFVTNKPGGRGAVREAVEFILKAQGLWDGIMERYINE